MISTTTTRKRLSKKLKRRENGQPIGTGMRKTLNRIERHALKREMKRLGVKS